MQEFVNFVQNWREKLDPFLEWQSHLTTLAGI